MMATRRRLSGEEGTSLIELVVGMMLMTIFMGMFTGVVVMMNSAENKAESVNLTSSQLNQAFLTLDKTVRYAAAISPPAKSTTSGDWYVELRTMNTGSEICTQLHLQQASATFPVVPNLEKRTWSVVAGAAVTGSLTNFVPVAPGITNGGAATGSDQPFVLKIPPANVNFQQLTINLVSLSGSGATRTPSSSAFTVTAYNSTIPAPTAPICQEQGRP